MAKRPLSKLARLLAGVLATVAVGILVAYVFFSADRSTAPLDRAPEVLVVPAYYDPVFFQGQGFPVRRRFVVSGTHEHDGATVHVLPDFDNAIDYKNTQETAAQVEAVNARFAPQPPWRFRPERRLGHYRCMATATSLVLDWFALRRGAALPDYVSIFDGRTYHGFDPRAIDEIYFEHADREPETFQLTNDARPDPVTSTPVPYSIAAFARLVEDETARPGRRVVHDRHLPIEHVVELERAGRLVAVPVLRPKLQWRAFFGAYPRKDSERVRRALESYGPLLAGIKIRFSVRHGVFRDTRLGDLPILGPSGHGVVIVGWIEKGDRLFLLYRETFGDCDEEQVDCGPAYRIFPVYGFNEIFAFRRA